MDNKTKIGYQPLAEVVQENDLTSFLKKTGINELLEGASLQDYVGFLPVPFIINEEPINISQADLDFFLDSQIHELKEGQAVILVAKATVLAKGPDGQLYRLYMTRGENGRLIPYQYERASEASVKSDHEALAQFKQGSTKSEKKAVESNAEPARVLPEVAVAQDAQELLEDDMVITEAKKEEVKKKRGFFARLFGRSN